MNQLTATKDELSLLQPESAAGSEPPLRPLSFKGSLLLFGIPALIFLISFHWFIPFLEGLGIPPMASFITAGIVPTSWLLVASLVNFHIVEGRPLSWKALSQRLRYPRPRFKDLLWGVGIYLLGLIGLFGFTVVIRGLIDAGIMPVPQNLPLLLDPRAVISNESLDLAAGGRLQGQWGLVILYLVYLFFTISGEESWWRGTLLPRQELRHGKWAWAVHGTLWASFHVFKWWDILAILPLSLIMSFSAQRLQNNWPAAIAHLLGNLSFFFIILAGVIG